MLESNIALASMQPPHLSRTDVSPPGASSPNIGDSRPFTAELRKLVCEVAPLALHQNNIFSALEEHAVYHEAQLCSLPVTADGTPCTWPNTLVMWLVDNKCISAPMALAYRSFFKTLVDRVSSPSTCNAGSSASGSRKRNNSETSSNSELSSTSPTLPKAVCKGKRFPGIADLNPAHPKFWEYLVVAARLSVSESRTATYVCVCGKERDAKQAYNFGRHIGTCANPPGILTVDGAPTLPSPPSKLVCEELAKLSPSEFMQIPEKWRELIPAQVPAHPPCGDAPPGSAALLSVSSEPVQAATGVVAPLAAFAAPVALEELTEPAVVGQFEASSLIAAMGEAEQRVSDFCFDPKVLHSA